MEPLGDLICLTLGAQRGRMSGQIAGSGDQEMSCASSDRRSGLT